MAPTLTTKLEAVNEILSVIGEQPVGSLVDLPADAAEAERTLDRVNKEVQSEGWAFNVEEDVELVPNGSDEIVLALNVSRAWVPCDPSRYVFRDGKLYDRQEHTFTITKTLKATTVTLMDFDEIPESIRRYVLIRSARIFQDRVLGDSTHHTYNRINEEQARAKAKEEESRTGQYNLLRSPGVAQTLFRRGNPLNRLTHL